MWSGLARISIVLNTGLKEMTSRAQIPRRTTRRWLLAISCVALAIAGGITVPVGASASPAAAQRVAAAATVAYASPSSDVWFEFFFTGVHLADKGRHRRAGPDRGARQ